MSRYRRKGFCTFKAEDFEPMDGMPQDASIKNLFLSVQKEKILYNIIAKLKRKGRDPKQYTVKEIFDDAIVSVMTNKYVLYQMSFRDEYNYIRSKIRELVKEKNKREQLNAAVKTAKLYFEMIHWWKQYDFLEDISGVWGIKNHVYTEAYGEIKASMGKAPKNILKRTVGRATNFLDGLRKELYIFPGSNSLSEEIEKLYGDLEEQYGNVINTDILIFFYVIYYVGLEDKKYSLNGNFSNLGKIFPEPEVYLGKVNSKRRNNNKRISKIENMIYEEVMKNDVFLIYCAAFGKKADNSLNRERAYNKIYDLAHEALTKEWSEKSLVEIMKKKHFLMIVYAEVITRCEFLACPSQYTKQIEKLPEEIICDRKLLKEEIHTILQEKKKKIRRSAEPFFCQLFCDIKTYEKNKMISLMLELTNRVLLDSDDNQEGKNRRGYTEDIKWYCGLMLSDAGTSKEEVGAYLKSNSTERIRKKCEYLIYKEFKDAVIPEWNDNQQLSPIAKRCNCMMMIAAYSMCHSYEGVSDVYILWCWLGEIWDMYKNRTKDRPSVGIVPVPVHFKLSARILSKYFDFIFEEFLEHLLIAEDKRKVLRALSNSIWCFQKTPVCVEKTEKILETISKKYWKSQTTPWFEEKD